MAEKAKYFIALIPPDPISAELMEFSEEVFERFQSKAALNSPPHITLHMPFQWREDKEDELKAKLDKFGDANRFHEITLKNFDFFEPSVVFVDVVKSRKLNELQKNLANYVRKEFNIHNASYKDKAFHPHVTIGYRDIKKYLFQDMKDYFSKQKYKAKFMVMDICLLKHNGEQWEEEFFF